MAALICGAKFFSNPVRFVEAMVQAFFSGAPIRGQVPILSGGGGILTVPFLTWLLSV
jgi:hypothetical protein